MRSGPKRRAMTARAGPMFLAALMALAALSAQAEDLMSGDSAWSRRAEGEREGRPERAPILQAIGFYERALAEHPGSLEARWKLLRALHFAGEFATDSEDDARTIFERARDVSETGIEDLAARVGSGDRLDETAIQSLPTLLEATVPDPRDVARLYFWSSINWGAWSRTVGLLSAVREGVANRIHRYVLVTIALEPDYDDGGAFRLLGRLHAELPRVPFVSGWVDREQAVPLIERAYALAPTNPGNRLLLALTLLDLAPERRSEALDLLDQVADLTPRPSMRIEDFAMRRAAQDAAHMASPPASRAALAGAPIAP